MYVVSAETDPALSRPPNDSRPAASAGTGILHQSPVYYNWGSVPPGLKAAGRWERSGRKVVSPRPQPAAYMQNVALYLESQTRPYKPKPSTLAFWETADFLLKFLCPRRDYYGFKSGGDPDAKGWPRTYRHLSVQTFRDALSGKEVLALFHAGGLAYWFALDVDFHPGDLDRGRFFRRLAAVHDELTVQEEDWFAAGVNPEAVSGCHFYVFSQESLPLHDVLAYAEVMKRRLIESHPDLFDEALEIYPTVGGNPLRMPVCKGRCVVLDRPLEGVPLREQAAALADWIRSPSNPMPKDEFVGWFEARTPEHRPKAVLPLPLPQSQAEVRPLTEEEIARLEAKFLSGLDGPTERHEEPGPAIYDPPGSREQPGSAAGQPSGFVPATRPSVDAATRPGTVPGPVEDTPFLLPAKAIAVAASGTPVGCRGAKVSYKGRFFEIMDLFWHSRLTPKAGTIGSYVGPWVRWAVAMGCTDEEIVGFLRRHLPLLKYAGLSGRLDGDIEELVRCELAATRRIRQDNGYQPDSSRSDMIFAGVVAASRRLGIDPLDPSTYGRHRGNSSGKLAVEDADLDEAQAKVVLGAVGWLSRDSQVVLAAARRVVGFVRGHPEREMAAVFVPVLCGDLGLEWFCPSDGGRRCKRAERFLKALVEAGVLVVERDALWRGRKREGNKARLYALGPVMGLQSEEEAGSHAVEREEGEVYLSIGDTSPCSPGSPLAPLRRELRRQRRSLGPSRKARGKIGEWPRRQAG